MTSQFYTLSFPKMNKVDKKWLSKKQTWTNGPVSGTKYFESWTEEEHKPHTEFDVSGLLRRNVPYLAPGQGGLQLFAVSRTGTGSADFPMSENSFKKISKEFDLHERTLDVFKDYNGSALHGFEFSREKSVQKLRIVMMSNVKGYLASNGVSLSYDFHSRITKALLYGTNLFDGDRPVDHQFENLFEAVKLHAKENRDLWSSPMSFPLLLVNECAERLQYCTALLRAGTIGLEYDLGISCSEYLADFTPDELKEERSGKREKTGEDKQNRETLLSDLGKQLLEADWLGRSCEAILDLVEFLREVVANLQALESPTSISIASETSCTMSYVIRKLQNNLKFISRMNNHIDSQRNILLSRFAQEDNETSKTIERATINMAFATVKDSMAMKILTLIAAFFLPPTVIAQIFSMSIFNWMASEPQDRIVSSNWWIYFACAITITAIVMFSAWLWVEWTKKRFYRNYPQYIDANSPPDPRSEKCPRPRGKVLARDAWV